MPDARTDELNALRHVAYVARAFLAGTADRASLDAALADLGRIQERLSRSAFRRERRAVSHAAGRGGEGGVRTSPTSKSEPDDGTTRPTAGEPAERSEATRTTWLTPPVDDYKRVYGEPPTPIAIKRMARAFKALEVAAPRDEVFRRFGHYLRATPVRFYSVEHFATTFPAWVQAVPPRKGAPVLDPMPDEDVDAYITRLARDGR